MSKASRAEKISAIAISAIAAASKPTARSPELDTFCSIVDHRIRTAEDGIYSFRKKLENDPADAFHWVNGAVICAASLSVWREVKKILGNGAAMDDGEIFSNIIATTERRVFDLASAGTCHSAGHLDGQLAADTLKAWMNVRELVNSCRHMNAPK